MVNDIPAGNGKIVNPFLQCLRSETVMEVLFSLNPYLKQDPRWLKIKENAPANLARESEPCSTVKVLLCTEKRELH